MFEPRKMFYNFLILIEVFGNSTVFLHFDTSICSAKTIAFQDNLDFKGKIVVKFFMKIHFLSIQNNITIK